MRLSAGVGPFGTPPPRPDRPTTSVTRCAPISVALNRPLALAAPEFVASPSASVSEASWARTVALVAERGGATTSSS